MSRNDNESTLVLKLDDFRRRCGWLARYGRDYDKLGDKKQSDIDDCIADGLRTYLYPSGLPDIGTHEWSFMQPTYSFETEQGVRDYDCPDDFDRPVGEINYSENDTAYYRPIKHTTERKLGELQVISSYESYPDWYAIIELSSAGTSGIQRRQVSFHPTPDAVYKLSMKYFADVSGLTDDRPYPPGGPAHAQGILLSCLAQVELNILGMEGSWQKQFQKRIMDDVLRDRNRDASFLGYMGEGGTTRYHDGRGHNRNNGNIFFGDVTYVGGES